MDIEKLWDIWVGNGVGEVYLNFKFVVMECWIFMVFLEGLVMKLDCLIGKREWKVDLEWIIIGGVGVGYGMVVLGIGNGELVVLSEDIGELFWEKFFGG